MIVKNESHVIERCLDSVIKYIDSYCICDTGSDDDTKIKIDSFFKKHGINGEIHDDKWVDYGFNRTKALERCYGKTKWAIMIDADDRIEGDLDMSCLEEDKDGYNVLIGDENCSFMRIQIFNLKNKKWTYQDAVHEYPTCEGKTNIGTMSGTYKWHSGRDGGRSLSSINTMEKYMKDYIAIKSSILRSGNSSRRQFYLAQSAFDAGMYDIAEKEYLKRINMEGWPEESFYSWFKIGMCREWLGAPEFNVTEAYMNAHEIDNKRAEPLHAISVHLRKKGKNKSAFIYAYSGKDFQINMSKLFVDKSVYLWKIHDEIGTTAYYAGQFKIGIEACEKLLKENYIPEFERERVLNNLFSFYNKII